MIGRPTVSKGLRWGGGLRAKPKAMQHANPYHIIQNNRPNVYTQLGCSSGRGGGDNGDMTVCQAV